MIYVMLGPPLSGKGTQSQILRDYLKALHINAGDLLRQEIKQKTPLGLEIQSLIEQGFLVRDELIFNLVRNAMEDSAGRPQILDGYPRTTGQAKLLMDHTPAALRVFLFDLSEDMLLSRMANRITCGDCGTVYNRLTNPPKQEGVCDQCGGRHFVQRKDDDPEIFQQRIKMYREETTPLIDFFESFGLLYKIDASRNMNEVTEQIMLRLEREV